MQPTGGMSRSKSRKENFKIRFLTLSLTLSLTHTETHTHALQCCKTKAGPYAHIRNDGTIKLILVSKLSLCFFPSLLSCIYCWVRGHVRSWAVSVWAGSRCAGEPVSDNKRQHHAGLQGLGWWSYSTTTSPFLLPTNLLPMMLLHDSSQCTPWASSMREKMRQHISGI